MSVQNPEMFWCSDNDKMEWLFNLNAYKMATFASEVFASEAWTKRQDGLIV